VSGLSEPDTFYFVITGLQKQFLKMNKIGFIIILAIYALLNIYIFIRGRQALPSSLVIQVIYTLIFLLFSLGFIFVLTLEGRAPWTIIAVMENTGGYWLIMFLYVLAAVVTADLLRLTDHYFHIFPEVVKTHYPQAKLIYFGSVVFLVFLISMIGYARFSQTKIVNLDLEITEKQSSVNGLSIVAVSDIHLGDVIRKKRLEKYVKLINEQNPDIILIAGDLFDRNLHSVQSQKMDSILKTLNSKYGTYAVLGNHEYYGNLEKAIQIIEKSGIRLLRDTAEIIDDKLILIGRDDITNSNRKSLQDIIPGTRTNLPLILLDHQPLNLKDAVENNIDFQFSGHTHNGQLFPYNRIVSKMYKLAYGYRKIENTNFYVSSGLGLWGAPIRLGTHSEIVRITFR
jgi:uncharacterized protein